MENSYYIKILIERKNALQEEIANINNILSINSQSSGKEDDNSVSINGKRRVQINKTVQSSMDNFSKGKKTWGEYIKLSLIQVGGSAKASKVADFVVKNNPKIDKETARTAVKQHLSRLYRSGVINAIEGSSPKEGHLYKIKEPQ